DVRGDAQYWRVVVCDMFYSHTHYSMSATQPIQCRFGLQRGRLRARGVGTSVADVGFQFDLSPASPTPEPSSIIQLGMGLFAAMASVRKRIAERRPWRQPGLAGWGPRL